MQLKGIISQLLPPILLKVAKRLVRTKNSIYLYGEYDNWQKALLNCNGYDSDIILQKTKSALLKVKNGEAVYERDSVLFDHIEYSWPLLAGLTWVAARHEGQLNVLDFGGSLGSTYYQNKTFLSGLRTVQWNIIEQPHYVETGKACFADDGDGLHFYNTIAECLKENQPNVLILSGVLQYLESPDTILHQIMEIPADLLIIDRTPFWDGHEDRVFIQSVPPTIYPASYPVWVFSKERFFTNLKENWRVMTMFDDEKDVLKGPINYSFQGVFIVRESHPS